MLELANMLATTGVTSCAGIDIPNGIYNLVHTIILMIQVVVPILLIIWGMIDFAKAIIGGDEDKIKAGQKTFIKRLIAAIVVFLVVTIVSLLISLVSSLGAENVEKDTITECLDHFVKGVNS